MKPRHVVCAVRGGAESRETVTRAIELALEAGARLTFLHVMDAEFLQHATVGPLSVVYHELVEMGTFAMVILRDRAQRRGVERVDYVVLEGNIRRQLMQFARDTHAEVLVLGYPTRGPGRSVFEEAGLKGFTEEVEREGDLHVVLVRPSEARPA